MSKSDAKNIAFKVINKMFGSNGFAMKYVYAKQVGHAYQRPHD